MEGEYMRSGILANGKKDRKNTQWEIHNEKEQYKKYEYITIYENGELHDFYKTIKNKPIKSTTHRL